MEPVKKIKDIENMLHGIYLLLIVVFIALWIIQQFGLLGKKYYLIFSGIILTAVLALRNAEFGVIDMLRYSWYYDSIRLSESFTEAIFHSNGKDMGYWASNYLFAKLGVSFQLYVSLVAVFCIGSFMYFINKYSVNVIISCFILLGFGCYTFLFYGLRQAIALPIALFCLDACYKKKYIKTALLFILAVQFHWASVVILPFLLVSRIKFSNLVAIVYLAALLIMVLFSAQIGHIVTLLFSEDYEGTYESSGNIGGLGILVLSLLVWYIIVFAKFISTSYRITFFLHGFIILCMIQICSAYSYAFTRVNFYYFFSVLPVVVPMSFSSKCLRPLTGEDNKKFSLILSGVLIVLMITSFSFFLNGNGLWDYVFFWEEIAE